MEIVKKTGQRSKKSIVFSSNYEDFFLEECHCFALYYATKYVCIWALAFAAYLAINEQGVSTTMWTSTMPPGNWYCLSTLWRSLGFFTNL